MSTKEIQALSTDALFTRITKAFFTDEFPWKELSELRRRAIGEQPEAKTVGEMIERYRLTDQGQKAVS
jgi:hypothetical protein